MEFCGFSTHCEDGATNDITLGARADKGSIGPRSGWLVMARYCVGLRLGGACERRAPRNYFFSVNIPRTNKLPWAFTILCCGNHRWFYGAKSNDRSDTGI